MSSKKKTQIKIRSSIILKELRQLGHEIPRPQSAAFGDGGGNQSDSEVKEPPALELCAYMFRPVVASATLSRLSLTPLWRLVSAIVIGLLCLVLFYPWSRGALVEYFTFVSHPAVVVIFYVAVILVRTYNHP